MYMYMQVEPDNNDTQCNPILLDIIVLINTKYKHVYCNCFKVD